MAALKLVVYRAGDRLGEVPLQGDPVFEVGSAAEAHITLKGDPEIAPHHLKFFPQPPGFNCIDLSGKGFLLNGTASSLGNVSGGDLVQVGEHRLCFEDLAPAKAEVDFRQTVADEEPTRPATAAPPTPPAPPRRAPAAAAGVGSQGLMVVAGEETGRWIPLLEGTTHRIGRQGAEIVLKDLKISRTHCRVDAHGGVVRVTDLQSSNGVYVNEERIATQVLESGDQLRVGNHVLQFIGAG